tara:strand:- start:109 stop:333 length:225 start_codon:yes stop_codon:yes gene_type:complete
MTFTERELALIMVALDNTSNDLREHPARSAQTLLEAKDMNRLWDRIHDERLCLLRSGKEKRESASRYKGLPVYK